MTNKRIPLPIASNYGWTLPDMRGTKIHWECQKYGMVQEDYETEVAGNFIRVKIYEFNCSIFLEVWTNGNVILFKELEN